MVLSISLSLLVAHFVGDALLQSNWMALGKSKKMWPLTVHSSIYALCFLPWGWHFTLITGLSHWLTDFFTSRVSAKLWFIPMVAIPQVDEKETFRAWNYYARIDNMKRHWFFVWLLLDQLIHFFTLAWTAKLLGV